jgi:hypothetical protein
MHKPLRILDRRLAQVSRPFLDQSLSLLPQGPLGGDRGGLRFLFRMRHFTPSLNLFWGELEVKRTSERLKNRLG